MKPLLALVLILTMFLAGATSPVFAKGPTAASSFNTGQSLLKAGQYKQAQAAFRQAIAKHDHVALSYVGLGNADIDLGDSVAGFKAYQQAAALMPKSAAVNYYAAYAALNARAYTWAVTYATRSIQLLPRTYASYHLRFLAYGRLKNKKKQVADAHMEVMLESRSPDPWNDYGIALGNDGQLKPAISAFGKAIKLRPGYWAYYKNRAIIEIYTKQDTQALADFEKAAALAPDPADKQLMSSTAAKLKKRMHH